MHAAYKRTGAVVSSLDITREAGVACLTLNRPDKRNAIDDATRDALTQALANLDADPATRVVILTGAGTAFCAGVDLTTPGNVAVQPTGQASAAASPIVTRPRLTAPLDAFSKPVIAALNGVAVGGGLEMALACDIRIAATGARFGLTEVKIGSLPGSGGTQRLVGAVGRTFAAQMLFTGELISAEQALAAGLVSELHAPEALMGRAFALAKLIAENAPLSLVAIKKALRAATDLPLAAGFELERALYGALTTTQDREEGRKAFREKRKPNFQGK
jgi:E-phenylitaconyl-CoA hydratase